MEPNALAATGEHRHDGAKMTGSYSDPAAAKVERPGPRAGSDSFAGYGCAKPASAGFGKGPGEVLNNYRP